MSQEMYRFIILWISFYLGIFWFFNINASIILVSILQRNRIDEMYMYIRKHMQKAFTIPQTSQAHEIIKIFIIPETFQAHP